MSASKQKKARQEQKAAYMTERQIAEAKEAKKLKAYTLTFWIVLALCVSIVLGTFAVNPVKDVLYRNTHAVTIGEHELTSVEFNYFYIDAINNYCNQYSSYISYILNVNAPLSSQVYDKTNNITWADAFVTMATNNAKSTYALYDEAVKVGHKLTEAEQASIETMFTNLEKNSKDYGYRNANAYLADVYGNGAGMDTYREYYEINALADSYYQAYADGLTYTDAAMREYEANKMVEFNSYSFATYYINYQSFLETKKDEDGKTIAATEEEKEAAREAAKKAAEDLAAIKFENLDDFDKAIQALPFNKDNMDAKCTRSEDILYSNVNTLFRDWLTGKVVEEDNDTKTGEKEEDEEEEAPVYEDRTEGQMTVIENATTASDGTKTINGYYVIRYGSVNDNVFKLKDVRHLLVAFEGGTYNSTTQKMEYTDAEKKAAKDAAQALLDQWNAGVKTEESFAELANKESDDGDGTTGGLYEKVYPGQMVEAFNDWCFDANRKVGDVELVETEFGWHIIYFVGDNEMNYRDFMISNTMRNEDVAEWHEALTEAIKFVEVNTKYVNRDLILAA